MIPVTRKEQYLNRLAGEEQAIPETPITRTEQYLARLCGMETEIPSSPITREETYLAYLNGEDVTLPKPITRLEQFMAYAAGESETKPTPLTREEFYWDKYQGGEVPEEKTIDFASIITVTDALAKPLKACTVKITPVQSGSGDPSPDNIRPISGWTECNVVVSPTIDAEDGQTYNIHFPSEAGTVYGGTLDVVNGTLTVTHTAETYDGTENWIALAESRGYYISIDGSGYSKDEILKSSFLIGTNAESSAVMPLNSIKLNSPKTSLLCRVDTANDFPTVNDWKAFLEQNNLTVVYPLTKPVTYQLTPTEVQMLLGTNNLWADTGNILEGKYWGKKSSATRAMLNTLQGAREITEITPEEQEENADER